MGDIHSSELKNAKSLLDERNTMIKNDVNEHMQAKINEQWSNIVNCINNMYSVSKTDTYITIDEEICKENIAKLELKYYKVMNLNGCSRIYFDLNAYERDLKSKKNDKNNIKSKMPDGNDVEALFEEFLKHVGVEVHVIKVPNHNKKSSQSNSERKSTSSENSHSESKTESNDIYRKQSKTCWVDKIY